MSALAKTKKSVNMIEGPFLKKIILFAIPVLLTSYINTLYHSIDLAVVGHYNMGSGIAAIGSVSSISSTVTAVFMGLSVGSGVVTAQKIGAGHKEEITKVIHTSAVLAAILGGLISLVGVLLSRSLALWAGVPADVLEQSTLYLRVQFFGTIGHMIYNYMAAILRSAGDSRRPLYFLLISGAVKVLLSILFVGGLRIGVAGVALATSLSHYLSAAMVLTYMARQKGDLHFSLRHLQLDFAAVKKILVIGIPSGIQSSLFSLSNVLIQASVNSFGSVAIAGNTAGDTLGTYVYYIGHAIYQATLTFVGQNMGAKRYDNIKRIVKTCIVLAVVSQLFAGLLILLLRSCLIGFFVGNDEAIREVAFQRMLIECPVYFFCGIMDVFSGALRGMGKSVTNTIVSLMGACVFRIAWVKTIFLFVERNIGWIFISKPISWVLVGVFNGLFFLQYYRKCVRAQQQEKNT